MRWRWRWWRWSSRLRTFFSPLCWSRLTTSYKWDSRSLKTKTITNLLSQEVKGLTVEDCEQSKCEVDPVKFAQTLAAQGGGQDLKVINNIATFHSYAKFCQIASSCRTAHKHDHGAGGCPSELCFTVIDNTCQYSQYLSIVNSLQLLGLNPTNSSILGNIVKVFRMCGLLVRSNVWHDWSGRQWGVKGGQGSLVRCGHQGRDCSCWWSSYITNEQHCLLYRERRKQLRRTTLEMLMLRR